jgi:hypothetical protein
MAKFKDIKFSLYAIDLTQFHSIGAKDDIFIRNLIKNKKILHYCDNGIYYFNKENYYFVLGKYRNYKIKQILND